MAVLVAPSFQLTVNHSPCYAPVVENAYGEIPKVSQGLVFYTSKSLSKARLGKVQHQISPVFIIYVSSLAPVSASNLSFIFVHGIMTNRRIFLTTPGPGLLFFKKNTTHGRIWKPYQIINLSQFLTL